MTQAFPHLLVAGPHRLDRAPQPHRDGADGLEPVEPDGAPGERVLAYFEARARGGAALVIVEVAAVAWPLGAANPNQLGVSDDRFLPGLARLARRIHAHGAKAALQLQHAGSVATRDVVAGRAARSCPPSRRRMARRPVRATSRPRTSAQTTADFIAARRRSSTTA